MKKLLCVAVLTTFGSAASALDFYAGGALDYGYPHSGDAQTLGTFLAGVGIDQGTFGYGAEIELGTHMAGDGDFDTQRLRARGTYDLGVVDATVAAGVTEYDFGNTTYSGYNLGLGVQNAISDNLTLRAEFLRDFMDDSSISAVTTTRIGAVFNF